MIGTVVRPIATASRSSFSQKPSIVKTISFWGAVSFHFSVESAK